MTAVRKRLVVLVSGSGSNLQALIDACRSEQIPGDIVCVISNKPGVLGLNRAEAAGIATAVLEHQHFSAREDYDSALLEAVQTHQPDLVILAGFMRILTPVFVAPLYGRLLNIHPSLLPKYPGLHTHQRALEAGDSEAGATVHFVSTALDAGPSIIHSRVPVLPDDTADSLAQRVLREEHRIYPLAVQWCCEGRLRCDSGGVWLDEQLLPPNGIENTP